MHKEVIGNCTLYLGDCLTIMPSLGRADCILTDPPYGVLEESWDDMTERELTRFSMAWLSMVGAMSDTMIVFFGERRRGQFSSLLTMLYPEVRQLIWNKNGGQAAADRFFYAYESIYFCHPQVEYEVEESAQPKNLAVAGLLATARTAAGISRGAVDMLVRGKKTGLCYRWEEACCIPTKEQAEILKKHLPLGAAFDAALAEAYSARDAVLEVARANTGATAAKHAAKSTDILTFSPPPGKLHPCEKPVQLLVRLLDAVPDASSIFDPFMGSGSTGVACHQMGRSFVGIERDEKYFATACERIENAQRQQGLFAA